jgi:hypothetical protein
VRLHPDGSLFVGDQVSLEVIAPTGMDLDNQEVYITINDEVQLGSAHFAPFGIGGRNQATFFWAWDTTNFPAGNHQVSFSIQPAQIYWDQTVSLLPSSAIPEIETDAVWAVTESDCCLIHYITNTAAERDLPSLEAMADLQAEHASQMFGYKTDTPASVVFIPRLIGHGGFASQEVSISYLDRNYATTSPQIILHHELVHLYDNIVGDEFRPTIFVEGLAVFASGGHFKPEPLLLRAKALLDLGWYIPLASLTEDFYQAQHEISYIQAGALVEFMVDQWGWQAFQDFYRDIPQPAQGEDNLHVINMALQQHFSLSFVELENRFLLQLREYPPNLALQDDVRLTIEYLDTIRRYQQLYDPSAYFLAAWTMDSQQLRQRNIMADYLRHPSTPNNLALETMLQQAGQYLQDADFESVSDYLQAINIVLEATERNQTDPLSAHPLANEYRRVVMVILGQGYQPQRIQLEGSNATALATLVGTDLWELQLNQRGENWLLTSISAFE